MEIRLEARKVNPKTKYHSPLRPKTFFYFKHIPNSLILNHPPDTAVHQSNPNFYYLGPSITTYFDPNTHHSTPFKYQPTSPS